MPKTPSTTKPSSAALRRLDTWLRATGSERDRLLAQAGEGSEALRAFASIWSRGPAAYRSSMMVEAEVVFGEEFEDYARRYAEDGVNGLAAALRREQGMSPAYLAWSAALVEIGLKEQELHAAGPALGRLITGMLAAGYDRGRVLELRPSVEACAGQLERFIEAEDYRSSRTTPTGRSAGTSASGG